MKTKKNLACILTRCGTIVLTVLLSGCVETKDELTLEADGTGKVRIETRTSILEEMMAGTGLAMGTGSSNALLYPPITESEAKKYFLGDSFKATVRQEKIGKTERMLIIEATFKDVNALLNSPYARFHALTLKIESGRLMLKGLSGFESVAWLAEVKSKGKGFEKHLTAVEMEKLKTQLRTEFSVTLPNAVKASNGAQDGQTVRWITERAKCANVAEFAEKISIVLEASCSAENLRMLPVTPPRLALLRFQELQTGDALLKLTNAVPVGWVEPSDNDESKQRALRNMSLPEFGLKLTFQIGLSESGLTTLVLQAKETKTVFPEAQVFDAKGRPWPTLLLQQGHGHYDIMVAGRPAAPLSFAFLIKTANLKAEAPTRQPNAPSRSN